jgi:hypothetical protein
VRPLSANGCRPKQSTLCCSSDHERWLDTRKVLTNLPPQAIIDNYGTEMLAWAAVSATLIKTGEAMVQVLAEQAGYDATLFGKAKLWNWQRAGSREGGKDILGQYGLLHTVLSGGLDEVDLEKVLVNAAHPDVELHKKRLSDYSLLPLRPEEGFLGPYGWAKGWHGETEPGVRYKIWLDTPAGFALTYKGKPNAVAAIALSHTHVSELMIHQLQGVRATKLDPTNQRETPIGARGLMPLDWRKAMVGISAELASTRDLEHIGIQAGTNNKWTIALPGETEPHLTKQAAAQAYDTPARRLGFRQGKDGNWHKPSRAAA